MIDKKKFYSEVRSAPFGKVLTQQNVDGMEAILNAWDADYRAMDMRYLAYILATVFEETDGTMRWDIEEKYNGNAKEYFSEKYDFRRDLGNTNEGDGYKFRGRSFCQVTGRRNYTWASTITGVDLVANPDKLKEKDTAVKVLFQGMITGHFTGRKLSDFFKEPKTDREYLLSEAMKARTIINGHDNAYKIATYFMRFYQAIVVAQQPDAHTEVALVHDTTVEVVPAVGAATIIPVLPTPPVVPENTDSTDPVDHGKPLYKSLTVAGGAVTTVFGAIGTMAPAFSSFMSVSSYYPIIAIAVFLIIVLGFFMVILGRKRIQYESGY